MQVELLGSGLSAVSEGILMKCPVHNVEMSRIAETVNEYDGTSVYWLCEGIGRYPRKHILMTEDWLGDNRFYEPVWERWIR